MKKKVDEKKYKNGVENEFNCTDVATIQKFLNQYRSKESGVKKEPPKQWQALYKELLTR